MQTRAVNLGAGWAVQEARNFTADFCLTVGGGGGAPGSQNSRHFK